MARKEDRKKQKKRRREAKEKKRTDVYSAEKTRRANKRNRPQLYVDPKGGDPVFVKRVQAAASSISLEESEGCPHEVASLVRLFFEMDFVDAVRHIRSEAALRHDHQHEIYNEEQQKLWAVGVYVGERIFEQLPEAYQRKLLPDFLFYPVISEIGVTIHFDSFERIKRDTGWGYYSRNEPTVTINGVEWVVCFSDHAIERIVERSCFESHVTYSHYCACALYLQSCLHYEPIVFGDGTPGIRLFMTEDLGGPPQRYRDYLQKVAGIDNVLQYPVVPAYVLGYSHVDCKGRFAKAISMWYPGFRGTPEDMLVREANISPEQRRQLLAMADDNKTVRVVNEGRHEAIKWYHENGVPQVIFPTRRLLEWKPR